MIFELPGLAIPEGIRRICELTLSNTRTNYATILDIIEDDSFLNLLVHESFKDFLKKGGVLGMLSALGWQGFRNRLGEAYLHHAQYRHFPRQIIVDEITFAIDFEKRFDFLFSENNSRVFMLGMYLKLCQIHMEREGIFEDQETLIIPADVDEILIVGKSKTMSPDWLIVIVWSFYQVLGKEKAASLLIDTKCDMEKIFSVLKSQEYELIMKSLLRYGQAINDYSFFTAQKV